MKDDFLYGQGQAAKGVNIDPIVAAAEALGKIAVGAADASKRRQMDYAFNQQRLNAELGLSEKSAQQQAELAKLNLIAQTMGGKPKEEQNIAKTIAIITIAMTGLVGIGVIIYVATKR